MSHKFQDLRNKIIPKQLTLEQRERYKANRKFKLENDPEFAAAQKERELNYFRLRYSTDPEYKYRKDKKSLDWRNNKRGGNPEFVEKERLAAIENTKKWPTSKYLFKQIKKSAKARGLDFNLDEEDLVPPENCPHCGIKLRTYIGEGSKGNDALSVDRLDNNKGYIKGNIAIVCWRANNLKRDATVEELELLIKWMKSCDNSA